MSDDTEKRIGHLLKLAEDAWKCMDSRRAYEWKVTFGLWTALTAFSALVLRGEVSATHVAIVVSSTLFIALWLVFTFVWTKGLYVRNKFDRDLAEHYWLLAEAALGPEAKSERAIKRKQHQGDTLWDNWSHRTQILITSILVVLAIVSMLLASASKPVHPS